MLVTLPLKNNLRMFGIIDKNGKVLRKARTLKTAKEKEHTLCYIDLFLI